MKYLTILFLAPSFAKLIPALGENYLENFTLE